MMVVAGPGSGVDSTDDDADSAHSSMLSETLTPCRLYTTGLDATAMRPSPEVDTSPCTKLTLRSEDGGEPYRWNDARGMDGSSDDVDVMHTAGLAAAAVGG
jgi:hypothetical protein